MDITALAASPVSESMPAGSDAKYEPEYEALTAEIAKLSSVSQSEPISWQAVADNGEAILARKSKDILVAAYMAAALQHLGGAHGFLDGATLLLGIFSNFWENAFPPKAKLRRRINAYEWWHERALEMLRKDGQPPIEAELASAMTKAAGDLDAAAGRLMEDAQPLRDIIEAIRVIPLLPEEKQEEPKTPAEPEPKRQTQREERLASDAAQMHAPAVQAASARQPADAVDAFSAFVEAARLCAFALRADDPADYLAWQIPRTAVWGKIKALPPDDGSGQTMVPPPDSERIEAAERLLAGKNWLKAALAADDLFQSYPLCIDLQRIADEALANLGPAFAAARARVRNETAAFVGRLPGLAALSYDGGVPFVSQVARAWLDDIARENSPSPAAQSGGGRIEEALNAAQKALAEGDASAALKKLEEAQGASAAGNLRLRTEELHILCSQREGKASAALARTLAREAEEIVRLEPDLAVEAMTAACRALELAGDADGADDIRGKIAGLRPSAVLGWN